MLTPSQAAIYRRMTLGDDALMASLFAGSGTSVGVGTPATTVVAAASLDERTASLVRLGALILADADAPAYVHGVRDALAAGASTDEITGVLVTVARVAGSARVMSAAPKLALALGYDVDAGLERPDSP